MTVRQHTRTANREKGKLSGGQPHAPHFSVILCTYNRRNLVLATLASLRRQTLPYADFEVIVVDNGSRDGTLNAVKAYVQAGEQAKRRQEDIWRVQCLSEPKNGLAYARNTGLLAATGQIAVFVDDDTLMDTHTLEQLWQAYQETGADAIGMRVDIQWDMASPHWMTPELLEMLGYFSPDSARCQILNAEPFASCAFSVKRDVLHDLNYFSPFLSKRVDLPSNVEVADLCLRLCQGGYTLWYEPEALVMHRATSARLRQDFFVGRAYWQGRSEIMLHYRHARHENPKATWQEIWREFRHFAHCFCVQTPLIQLAGRSTNERLLAEMEQAHSWGRLTQCLTYLEHLPPDLDMPAVLLVHSETPDPSLDRLEQLLDSQEVRYLSSTPELPLRWLWQHRRYQSQPVGILHFYRPGLFELTRRQSQRLLFRLWLARRWGLRVVVTDNGGWWQSVRGSSERGRRAFERKMFQASHAILTPARQPNLLYRERRLRKRTRYLPQPGFRGFYPPALPRDEAHQQLGLPIDASFVYLCLAHLHTEEEIIFLLEAFNLLTQGNRQAESQPGAYLLLVGTPIDCDVSSRILRLVARNAHIHTHLAPFEEADIPTYMGAGNAYVLPHFAVHTAGNLESSSLALSHNLLVIAPNLPRFGGALPSRASVPYVPASRESLAEAMIKAQQMHFTLQENENAALDARQSWDNFAQGLLKIYGELLGHK